MEPILGHDAVVDRLFTAVDRGTLHHALLFEGPAGVGKGLVATRLAMYANCAAEGAARPCGVCGSCRQILAGSHPDVIRVGPDPEKATAIIAVDKVREVVRTAAFHRYSAKRRFVIVDPAEAMQPSAANALLKTLEEPPPHTGFVLIATHASALLPTVVSRSQRVRFGPVPEAQLAEWLRKRGAEDSVAAARLSLGCPGKAIELADGRIAERAALRQELVDAVSGDLGRVFAFSERITAGGNRQEWQARVEVAIGILEDLLRDVSTSGTLPPIDPDAADVVARWRPILWPDGVAVCGRAIAEAREHLLVNATGRTVVDALLTRVRAELGG